MLVEFIIPTYYRPAPLKSMLASLIAQTDGDWGTLIMIDNEKNEEIEAIINSFNDERIRHHYMDKRYNDWGHTPRQQGKQMSNADYIIMTGDDNYYTPNFVEELKKAVLQYNHPGVVYWDMVHSHYRYEYFECRLGGGQIDMGAFATRKDIAHDLVLNTEYAADGFFIEEYKRKYFMERSIKINKVLFVHN
jgi:glycosyltransferase involved in cell wall biosynthesis